MFSTTPPISIPTTSVFFSTYITTPPTQPPTTSQSTTTTPTPTTTEETTTPPTTITTVPSTTPPTCQYDVEWGEWGACLPCFNGTRTREGTCTSPDPLLCPCPPGDELLQTEDCTSCQCEVTREDVDDELGPGFLPDDGVLGTIEGTGEQVQLVDNVTYLEPSVTIEVGQCVECMCMINYTFACFEKDPCFTSTPTTPSTPFCWSPWSKWTNCPYVCMNVTSTRNRTCDIADPRCNCTSDFQTQIQDCACTTSTTPASTTVPTTEKECFEDCFNQCTDTCRFAGTDCEFTTSSEKCKCKECASDELQDEYGNCWKREQCPCYVDGVEYQVNKTVSFPDNCTYCTCMDNHQWECQPIPDCCLKPPATWMPWMPCELPAGAQCGPGQQKRHRFHQCPPVGLETETEDCYVDPEPKDCYNCSCTDDQQVNCVQDYVPGNTTWTDWSEWSLCTENKNCRDYQRMRCRSCIRPDCGPNVECDGPAVESEPCSSDPCCDVYEWAEWSECSASCDGGQRTRTKKFFNNETEVDCAQTQVVETEECGTCDCGSAVVTEWSDWSNCMTTSAEQCGWGLKSRTRTTSSECAGMPDLQSVDCYISDCACDEGYVYSNYSQCHPTCQMQTPDPSCSLNLDPKCVCAGNMYMDMTTQECVPVEQCQKCVYENTTYESGDRWECGECNYCSCCAGNVVTERKECPNIRDCDLSTHKLIPGRDSCCPVDCVPKECELKTKTPKRIYNDQGCVSPDFYTEQYCEGDCPYSSLHIDYMSSTFDSTCRCCAALVYDYKKVQLNCANNQTVEHFVPMLKGCRCDVSVCSPGEEGGQSQTSGG